MEPRIRLLLASPHSRFVGRPADGPAEARGQESHESVEIRAGLGVVGDRYFNAPAHRRASVTLFAIESLEHVHEVLGLAEPLDPAAPRRNVVTEGVDVDALVGETFALDSGDGPVLFQANRPANPCAWMDQVLAPGAFRALKGRGGVRCEPLSSGILRLGPLSVETERLGDSRAV
ncbi:hypothetical protein AS850_15615 [Frondihabitans sp. 762G35]|uniref:MOSC domain-containing protein n=1 Tax=Frondihabitans sp. 762G35 TaxID=1446794 RepID=UPI000D226298|nr:MOSC domain-containing protein [Frondihabitans sp. 762G35]ARC58515.1 hypothetical protein AS850_15615 [Frondihabitans sp. 762G35]